MNPCPHCGQHVPKPRPTEPSAAWLECERAGSSRPLTAEEIPHAEAFGRVLRKYRKLAGLTMKELAEETGFNVKSISRLELGCRRPRHSTVVRLVKGLGPAPRAYRAGRVIPRGDPDYRRAYQENPDQMRLRIVAELLGAVGPALAPPRKDARTR